MAEAVRPKQKHRKKVKVKREHEDETTYFTSKANTDEEDHTIKKDENRGLTTPEANEYEHNSQNTVTDISSSRIENEKQIDKASIHTEDGDGAVLCQEKGEKDDDSVTDEKNETTGLRNKENEKQGVVAKDDHGISRHSSSDSYTAMLQAGPAVVEDPDTPMARAASPAVSRSVSDESKSVPLSVAEAVVIEEKSPHLLAEEAFARMQALAENLRISSEEVKQKDDKSDVVNKSKSPRSSVAEAVVVEEKSPHLLAEEAFARMQVLAENLKISATEAKENEERSGIVEDAKSKSENEQSSSQIASGVIIQVTEQQQSKIDLKEAQEVPSSVVKSPTGLEVPKTKIRAMSLPELLELYHNPQLAYSQQFIEEFVQNEMKKEGHEFFEILSNYLRARLQLVSVEEEISLLQTSYNTLQEAIWITTTKSVVVQGECGDKAKVTASHTYEQCQLNRDAVKQMENTLKKIREQITTDLSLFAYSSMISKLQVESYIHDLYTNSPVLSEIPKNAPVQAQSQYAVDQEGMQQIIKLKDCISILFMFHRKPVSDHEFVNNIRSWTTRLVSSLLRVATFRDHLFVLNHLLRCPAGVGKWAVDLVQFTKISPASISGHFQSSFSNDILDHVITALSTVLLPVKAREDFLSQMKINLSQESIQEEKTWILVDSDGEEDEEPSNAWLYLHENDVVAILNQFSLSDLFSHILLSTVSESGQVDYDIRRSTEPIMMKLLSFSTVLVQLFGSGLRTFNMVRYRQLNKRIGRLIRHTISFVSDHWLNFKTHYGPMTTNTSMETLQMEFDQLFMRATYCILTAQKLGSWQFMADMPYTCVSEGAMWQLLWILHQGQGQVINLDFLPPAQQCKAYIQDPDSWQQLADNLTHMPTSEAFFLMTTFANMACCRSYSEQDFVQTITFEVFEIAYISTHTRDFCSKMGRELLSSIILTHPSALSFLLARVKEVMSKLGKMSLYLFSELPVGVWQPTDPDMLILRQWLLNFSLTFVENQLARTILSKINWDVFEQTGRPVIDIRLHRQTALLLVESYTRYISDKRAGFFITEGMRQMTSYMTSSPSPEQVFNNWAWDLALRLKLHQQSIIWQASSQAVDPNFQPPCLSKETWLLPVMNGSINSTSTNTTKIPIACFIALSMTDVGHDVTLIMRDGLDLLNHLTFSGQYTTSIHVLGCLVPLFVECQQYLLENECFQQIIQSLVVADESLFKSTKSAVMSVEFPGLIIKQLNEMIQAQISSHLMGPKADLLLSFWLKAIFKVSRYFMDRNCCYIANSLAQWCFVKKGVTDLYLKSTKEFYTQFCAACKDNQNVMSAVISWISSSQNSSPSFLDSPAIPEFPWIAFLLMLVEGEREGETGLWYTLQMNLQASSKLSVDAALKSTVTSLQLQQAPTIHKLVIYRWAKQALDTPLDHPILPILWQRFFALYLGRQASQSSMSQRASVGERFFESMSYSGMMKKMRKRLKQTSDYHLKFDPLKNKRQGTEKGKASSPSEDPGPDMSLVGAVGGASAPSSPEEENNAMEYTSTKEFHLILARLYQTYLLWLEEPRLHDANLYLPALPLQYEASRLNQIFQGYVGPWLEFVDTEGVQYMLSCLAADWRNHLAGARLPNQPLPDRHKLSEPENATKRIEQRLKRYDSPKDPPVISKVQTAVPLISPSIVVDKDAFLQLVSSDLELLRQHTQIFSAKNANHSALDDMYIQLLPSLYANVTKVMNLTAACRSALNPLHKCSLPASLPVRIHEKERNEITFRRIQENRVEYKQLMIEMLVPTPLNICIAAVHTENAITCLIKQCQKSSNPSQKRLRDIGCTLFFQLTSLVSEDTNFYPPAKHFFASCIEILGQEFVSEDPNQTETVLQLCLDRPLVSGLASPHFVPNSCPDRIVDMYGQLIHVLQEQNMDLVFMLLTKFDISLWLEQHRPIESERKKLVEILGSSLTTCGPDPESSMVFGLYVAHLKALLRSGFPSNMSCILNMILQGSASNLLNDKVWETFLAVCFSNDPRNSSNFDAMNIEGCNEVMLSTAEVKEYLDWMGSFFIHNRITACQNKNGSKGLHETWAKYSYYIGLFLGGLIRSYAAKILRVSDDISSPFQILNSLWNVYAPWIQPMVGDNEALNIPWMEADGQSASHIISSLSASLTFIHQSIMSHSPDRAPGLLSLILMHYITVLCTKTTPPHAVEPYLRSIEKLPWETLGPDVPLVEAMIKVKENASPCCFSLIGHVMPFVKWDAVNKYHIHHTTPEIASRMQTGIALLHIQSYVDLEMLKRDGIYRLLVEAETFDWSAMNIDGITCVTSWFLQLGDPACVLAERSSRLAIGLRVLKQICGFTTYVQWHSQMVAKRHTYVHVMTQQFCQLTYIEGTSRESVNTALVNLLSEIEAVESSVPTVEGQNEESFGLLKSVCGLLNNSNPDGAWLDAILATLTGWLKSSPQSILLAPCMKAASSSLASLKHMVVVMEACVTSYFTGLAGPSSSSSSTSNGWDFILSIFNFPELNPAGFVQEALAENAFLVLYAYFRYKVPFCQTPDQRFVLIEEILTCAQKSGPNTDDDMKILLWWHLLLDMLAQHLKQNPSPTPVTVNIVNRFIPYLNAMGQDRNNKGLLGAIGFGQKSSLSKRMRLMSIVLSSYLQSQLINSNHLRIDSRTPLPMSSVPKELRTIRASKSYAELSAQCDKAIVFMRDPSRSFLESAAFVAVIGQEMFPDFAFLQHAFI